MIYGIQVLVIRFPAVNDILPRHHAYLHLHTAPVRQTRQAWAPSNKAMLFQKWGELPTEVQSHF